MTKIKVKPVKTTEEAIIGAKRYFENAKQTLNKSIVEWDTYRYIHKTG